MKPILKEEEFLNNKRNEISKKKAESRWYRFLEKMFKEKTTFEKYILLIIVLQFASLACSVVSYYTSHSFVEHYMNVYIKSPAAAFNLSVTIIVLIEAVKMVAAIPLMIRLVQFKGVNWLILGIVAAAFAGSAFASYSGGEIQVTNNRMPDLIKADSIANYYNSEIGTLTAEKKNFQTDKKYQTKEGVVFLKVLKNHVEPLGAEILRLRKLRDESVKKADKANKTIKENHKDYVTADAFTMSMIALFADLIKIFIALITAVFIVSSAKDHDIIFVTPEEGEDPAVSNEGKQKKQKNKKKKKTGKPNQIGFNTNNLQTEKQNVRANDKQGLTDETQQRQTIPYKGKQIDRSGVTSRINTHKKREAAAAEKGNAASEKLNRNWVVFWNQKLKEFN